MNSNDQVEILRLNSEKLNPIICFIIQRQ